MNPAIDTQRLAFILNELRLPAIKQIWSQFAEQADKEAWPATRFLSALAEHEISERDRRRIERHLSEARLPPGKTLDSFDFTAVPMISKARIMALCAGDSWLEKGANLIMIGGPRSEGAAPAPGTARRRRVRSPALPSQAPAAPTMQYRPAKTSDWITPDARLSSRTHGANYRSAIASHRSAGRRATAPLRLRRPQR
jgi:hypothetical protein